MLEAHFMKLTPTQLSIVIIQIIAISMNLYTIFITQIDDYIRHWINITYLSYDDPNVYGSQRRAKENCAGC